MTTGDSEQGRAFITGGSGFIGGRLIERLRADGHEVRALARAERSASAVRELGAEPVHGDLGDVESLRARRRTVRPGLPLRGRGRNLRPSAAQL